MVSLSFNQDQGFYLVDPNNMRPLPSLGFFPPPIAPRPIAPLAASASLTKGDNKAPLPNDLAKKPRKPYTFKNARETWSEEEHDKFLEALQLFDRDWKKIKAFVGSKTVIQIRSHAQKYFLKVQRYGGSEHIPPPRAKRKARHPYPKASGRPQFISHADGKHQSETHYTQRQESSLMLGRPPIQNSTPSSWTFIPGPSVNVPQVAQADKAGQTSAPGFYFNNKNESSIRSLEAGVRRNYEGDRTKATREPDFGKIYRFIGSIFEPDATGHLERLQKMEPVDLETTIYLMQNLSINLKSPEFENQNALPFSFYFLINVGTSRVDKSHRLKWNME